MKPKNISKLIISIFICQFAGIIGSLFTSPTDTWYTTLNKPDFTPPNWLFAPVWIILYTLMGISLYLILNKRKNKIALYIFGIQLVLNSLWSILFFGLKSIFYSFIEIIVLWIVVTVTIVKFYRIDRKAGLLLIPYILWTSFAMILNFYIWALN